MLDRKITLYCPICGNSLFSCIESTEFDDYVDAPDNTRFQCADCKNIISKADLIESNQDTINANIEDIKKHALHDIEEKIKKIFK